jgi:hypothetical protein
MPNYPSGAARRKLRIAKGLPAQSAEADAKDCDRRNRRSLKRQASNLAFIAEYKVSRGCADCGYNAHPAALDFDHLPGADKVRGLSRMVTCGRDRLMAEIAKCEVVCANCHRVRTYSRRYPDTAVGLAALARSKRSSDPALASLSFCSAGTAEQNPERVVTTMDGQPSPVRRLRDIPNVTAKSTCEGDNHAVDSDDRNFRR